MLLDWDLNETHNQGYIDFLNVFKYFIMLLRLLGVRLPLKAVWLASELGDPTFIMVGWLVAEGLIASKCMLMH